MKFVAVLIWVIGVSTFAWGCDDSKVFLTVVSHRKVESTGSDPLLVRDVRYRVANNTGCRIFVKGHQVSQFFPLGGYMRRRLPSKKWSSSSGKTEIPDFGDLGYKDVDDKEIAIGESIEFTSKLGDAESSVKFKRIIYVSVGRSDAPPITVVSSEFSFNSKL